MFEVVELIDTEVIAFRDGVGVLEIDDGVGGGANGVAWFAKTKTKLYIWRYNFSEFQFHEKNFHPSACKKILICSAILKNIKKYSQIILFCFEN